MQAIGLLVAKNVVDRGGQVVAQMIVHAERLLHAAGRAAQADAAKLDDVGMVAASSELPSDVRTQARYVRSAAR